MKAIVDVFAESNGENEMIWFVRGRDELQFIQQQFRSRAEALAFVEGLNQGVQIKHKLKVLND